MEKQSKQHEKTALDIRSDVRAGVGWIPDTFFSDLGWEPYGDQTIDVPKTPG